jgi:hypothetical protein
MRRISFSDGLAIFDEPVSAKWKRQDLAGEGSGTAKNACRVSALLAGARQAVFKLSGGFTSRYVIGFCVAVNHAIEKEEIEIQSRYRGAQAGAAGNWFAAGGTGHRREAVQEAETQADT